MKKKNILAFSLMLSLLIVPANAARTTDDVYNSLNYANQSAAYYLYRAERALDQANLHLNNIFTYFSTLLLRLGNYHDDFNSWLTYNNLGVGNWLYNLFSVESSISSRLDSLSLDLTDFYHGSLSRYSNLTEYYSYMSSVIVTGSSARSAKAAEVLQRQWLPLSDVTSTSFSVGVPMDTMEKIQSELIEAGVMVNLVHTSSLGIPDSLTPGGEGAYVIQCRDDLTRWFGGYEPSTSDPYFYYNFDPRNKLFCFSGGACLYSIYPVDPETEQAIKDTYSASKGLLSGFGSVTSGVFGQMGSVGGTISDTFSGSGEGSAWSLYDVPYDLMDPEGGG